MTYIEAALAILGERDEPIHYVKLIEEMLALDDFTSGHSHPERALYTALAKEMERGEASRVARVAPGMFVSSSARRERDAAEESPEKSRVRVPHFPLHAHVVVMLDVVVGQTKEAFLQLRADIRALTGNPQNPVDWTSPEEWIEARLSGTSAKIARDLWEGSSGSLNPRYTTGEWLLVNRYGLIEVDEGGDIVLSEAGERFANGPVSDEVRRIDELEGVLVLLEQIADREQCATSDLLAGWMEYLHEHTRISSENSARQYLYHRVNNLVARGLVEKASGNLYTITAAGLDYLDLEVIEDEAELTPLAQIRRLRLMQDEQVRQDLYDHLSRMPWQDFEHLVARLLEAMGYVNIEVTRPGGDGGVDVVADIELGITSVREVIQVKRQQANVHRPVLDALRGSLYRFQAVRGTIITLGGFSSGTRETAFHTGAAPITLIDGDKLIELLIENGLGVRRKQITLLEFTPNTLSTRAAQEIEEIDGDFKA